MLCEVLIIIGLEKSVSQLRESTSRSSADWRSLEEHMAVMKNMEDQKFDLARKINEQEAALSMLESEIEELRRKSDMLENWDVEEEVVMDKNAYVGVLTIVFLSISFEELGSSHTMKASNQMHLWCLC